MSWEMELNDEILGDLYEWIDKIPLSRQKRRIERDFADGYCVGEIIFNFLPQYIEMHNLTPAHNNQQKLVNWGFLNSKVFSRFGLNVPLNITQNISNARPGYIEVFLYNLRYKIEEKLTELDNQRSFKTKSSPRDTSFQMNSPSNKSKTNLSKLRLEYEEKVQECLKQSEEIEILKAQNRRLEHLLELKEARINDLSEKLDKYRPTAVLVDHPGVISKKKTQNVKNKNSISIS